MALADKDSGQLESSEKGLWFVPRQAFSSQIQYLSKSMLSICFLKQFCVLFSPDDLGLLTEPEPEGGALDSCQSGSWVVIQFFLLDCERVFIRLWNTLVSDIIKQHPWYYVTCLISYLIAIVARLLIVWFVTMLRPKPEEMIGLLWLLRMKVLNLSRHS